MVHRVVTVLAPGASPFEFSVAMEVFGRERPELGGTLYDHRLAATTQPVETWGGGQLDTGHGLEELEHADTVVVPAGLTDDIPEEVLAGVRDAYERGARTVSYCSGAFTLAAAGILDGRRATTHWLHVDELRRRFPKVRVDPDVLYVDDGQVLTSAGTAAAIDLSLHIVRGDHGAQIANLIARRMLVPPHRDGGQTQFAVSPVPTAHDDDPLGSLLTWMIDHLDEPLTVDRLAGLATMSPRTFARRFRQATGTTPLRWLHHQRVVRAQELLEVTHLTIDAIAGRVGFGNAANLREHFHRTVGTTPSAYRQRFRRDAA